MINVNPLKEVIQQADTYQPRLKCWEIILRFILWCILILDIGTDVLFLLYLMENQYVKYSHCVLAFLTLPASMSFFSALCSLFQGDISYNLETINMHCCLKPIYFLLRCIGFEAIFIYLYSVLHCKDNIFQSNRLNDPQGGRKNQAVYQSMLISWVTAHFIFNIPQVNNLIYLCYLSSVVNATLAISINHTDFYKKGFCFWFKTNILYNFQSFQFFLEVFGRSMMIGITAVIKLNYSYFDNIEPFYLTYDFFAIEAMCLGVLCFIFTIVYSIYTRSLVAGLILGIYHFLSGAIIRSPHNQQMQPLFNQINLTWAYTDNEQNIAIFQRHIFIVPTTWRLIEYCALFLSILTTSFTYKLSKGQYLREYLAYCCLITNGVYILVMAFCLRQLMSLKFTYESSTPLEKSSDSRLEMQQQKTIIQDSSKIIDHKNIEDHNNINSQQIILNFNKNGVNNNNDDINCIRQSHQKSIEKSRNKFSSEPSIPNELKLDNSIHEPRLTIEQDSPIKHFNVVSNINEIKEKNQIENQLGCSKHCSSKSDDINQKNGSLKNINLQYLNNKNIEIEVNYEDENQRITGNLYVEKLNKKSSNPQQMNMQKKRQKSFDSCHSHYLMQQEGYKQQNEKQEKISLIYNSKNFNTLDAQNLINFRQQSSSIQVTLQDQVNTDQNKLIQSNSKKEEQKLDQ